MQDWVWRESRWFIPILLLNKSTRNLLTLHLINMPGTVTKCAYLTTPAFTRRGWLFYTEIWLFQANHKCLFTRKIHGLCAFLVCVSWLFWVSYGRKSIDDSLKLQIRFTYSSCAWAPWQSNQDLEHLNERPAFKFLWWPVAWVGAQAFWEFGHFWCINAHRIFQPFVPDASPVSQGNRTQYPVFAVTLMGDISDFCCSSKQPSWDFWAWFMSVLSSTSVYSLRESSWHQLSLLQCFPLYCRIGCTEIHCTDCKLV